MVYGSWCLTEDVQSLLKNFQILCYFDWESDKDLLNVLKFKVKRGQFQNLQKSRGWFILKIARTKQVITA